MLQMELLHLYLNSHHLPMLKKAFYELSLYSNRKHIRNPFVFFIVRTMLELLLFFFCLILLFSKEIRSFSVIKNSRLKAKIIISFSIYF